MNCIWHENTLYPSNKNSDLDAIFLLPYFPGVPIYKNADFEIKYPIPQPVILLNSEYE